MISSQLQFWVNHLWQSTLFAAAAGLLTLALRKNRAQTRYRLWVAASVKFLIPFSLLVDISGRFGRHTAAALPAPRLSYVIEQASRSFAVPTPLVTIAAPASSSLASWVPAVLCVVWAIGFAMLVISRWLGWRGLRAALRTASPLNLAIGIEAMASPAFAEPGIFGVHRPVLLLPTGIADALTPSELEAIVTHELCHVRRRDNVMAAIHMGVEAVFWFHPLVWWIGSRLVEERERACDEEVLLMGREPEVYARGILKLCELCLEPALPCVTGVTGGNLKKRVEEIMANRMKPGLGAGKKLVLAAGGLAAVAIPMMLSISNVQLRAQTAAVPGTGVASWQVVAGGKMAFDEASVRRSTPPSLSTAALWLPSFPLDSGDAYVPGGRFSANSPLSGYISFAYKMQPTRAQYDSIFALWPKWVTTEFFEIRATAGGTSTKDQMRLMMQSLLADRFGLAIHYEARVVPVFALTLKEPGKLGPNLSPHNDSLPCDDTRLRSLLSPQGNRPSVRMGDTSDFWCGGFGMWNTGSTTRMGARDATMATFAAALPNYAGLSRPVIDQTGLSGRFDVQVEWEFASVVVAPNRAEPDLPSPSFLDAVREQLGLNLESTHAAVQTLVIDHVERPVEN
jgi:bla regulator protein blaR1